MVSILYEYSSNKSCLFLSDSIICVITVYVVLYGDYFHCSAPKVSKPPLAKPFFNQSSIVLDFYKGHLSAMIERVTEADFSFVMYYAPWDAESQAVRQEFEIVAQYYHSQVSNMCI